MSKPWRGLSEFALDDPELGRASGMVCMLLDWPPNEVDTMAAIVGPFQIRRLVKVTTGGIRDVRSGWVPCRTGQGMADATGKGRTYGP